MRDYSSSFERHLLAEDDHLTARRMRKLPTWMVSEIRELEGIKPAYLVAADFEIYIWRVRAIWNHNDRED